MAKEECSSSTRVRSTSSTRRAKLHCDTLTAYRVLINLDHDG